MTSSTQSNLNREIKKIFKSNDSSQAKANRVNEAFSRVYGTTICQDTRMKSYQSKGQIRIKVASLHKANGISQNRTNEADILVIIKYDDISDKVLVAAIPYLVYNGYINKGRDTNKSPAHSGGDQYSVNITPSMLSKYASNWSNIGTILNAGKRSRIFNKAIIKEVA